MKASWHTAILLIPAAWLVGFAAVSAAAQEPASNAIPTVAAESTTEAETNTVEMSLRDPFWPVGYQRPDPRKEELERLRLQQLQQKQKKEEVKKALAVAWPTLDVTGTSQTPQGKHVAMIKGIGTVEEGDTVRVRKDDIWYRWKVTSINEKGMSFKRLDAIPITPKN